MVKKLRSSLLDLPEPWEEHWQNMPEFIQKEQTPWKTIHVHFKSKEDMLEFSKLVKQKITERTKFIWYPKLEPENLLRKKCVDES